VPWSGVIESGPALAAHVERRRDLDHVAAHQVEPAQAAQHALRLVRGIAADLGRASVRRVGRIEVALNGERAIQLIASRHLGLHLLTPITN